MNKNLKDALPHVLKVAAKKLKNTIRNAYIKTQLGTVNCNVRNKNIKIVVSNEIEHFRAMSYSSKEPETLNWLDSELKDGDVFFDIGANIGIYSLYAAATKKNCTTYAFEPEAQNFSHLCVNIHQNSFKNIIPCSIALSSQEQFNYFYVSDMKVGSAFHSLTTPTTLRHDKTQEALRQGALTTSVDRLAFQYGLKPPNLIKIDVDGIEADILKGAARTLESGTVRSILIEINGDPKHGEAFEIFDFLQKRNFKLHTQGVCQKTNTGVLSANYIFKRSV